MSETYAVEYDNRGNGSYEEWLSIENDAGSIACVAGSSRGRLTDADRAFADLIAKAHALEADNAALRKLLRELEWTSDYTDEGAYAGNGCPSCKRPQEYGHAADCRLDAAITEDTDAD